jgi:YD repeat-containing protein
MNNITLPYIVPPSPTIASLDKFGNYSISYNTGTIAISVPLYHIPLSKDLILNLSIDYHSSGIKVNENNGIVGTGWALSTGGYISREIRGIRDEENGGGFYTYSKNHKGWVFPEKIQASTYPALFDSIVNHKLDPEPDLFTLNILGRNYKFFVGNDAEIHTIPYSNIKFRANPLNNHEGIGSWEIVDESGISYIFNVTETTEVNGWTYATSWRLSKIISAEGKELVSFEYTNTNEYNAYPMYKTQAFELFSSQTLDELKKSPYLEIKNNYYSNLWNSSNLSKIIIPGIGYLVLENTNAGGTLSGMLLRNIRYYSSDNMLKRTYSFNYQQERNRPYLSKIFMSDNENLSIIYRTFAYYPDLPDKGSYSQDFWGYYNGANNSSLFPYKGSLGNYPHPPYETGDRYPTDKAVAGSIKEITYPTGGKTQFEFENNKIFAENIEQSNIKRFSEFFSHSGYGQKLSNKFSTINEKMSTNITLSVHPAGIYSVFVKLIQLDNNKTILSFSDSDIAGSFIKIGTNSDGTVKYQYSQEIQLSEGTYQWVTQIINNEGRNINPQPISISFTYYANIIEIVSGEKLVGGLRILRMTNYDKDNRILNQKHYTYLDKNGKCSGIGCPEPEFVKSYVVTIPEAFGVLPGYLGLEEIGEINLNNFNGSAVQYTYVTEEAIENGIPTFKTEYEYNQRKFYRNIIPSINDVRGYVSVQYNPNDYEGGLLKTKIDYKYENGTYTPIIKEFNTYTIVDNDDSIPSFRALSVTKYYDDPLDSDISYDNRFIYGTYDVKASKVYLSNKRIEEIRGENPIVTIFNYAYSNPLYFLLTSSTRSRSGNSTMKTSYQYSFESNNQIFNEMKLRNMINMPITITTTVDDILTEKTNISYGYHKNNSIIEVSTINKQIGLSNLSFETNYHIYDNCGNPIHISQNGSNNIFYFWSYKGKYPIAEIMGGNYTYSEIELIIKNVFLVSNIDELSDIGKPNETPLIDASLQRALPNAQVTTYTYKPLIGMTSKTDPNGVTTYYEYDSFGRLKYIKDTNGKIIEQYDYHYRP